METYSDTIETILKEFMLGCLPENVKGTKRFIMWDETKKRSTGPGMPDGAAGWQGIERTRRATFLFARCLREGSLI